MPSRVWFVPILLVAGFVGLSYSSAFSTKNKQASSLRQHGAAESASELSPPSQSDGETAALRQRLNGLNAEVASLRQEMAAARATAKPDSNEGAPQPTREEAIASEQREWRAHISQVQAQFEREPKDPSWSATASSAVLDVLRADDAIGGAAKNVECRSTMCRFEVAGDERAVGHNLISLFRQLAPILPSAQTDRVGDGEGQQTTVVFLSRDMKREAVSPSH